MTIDAHVKQNPDYHVYKMSSVFFILLYLVETLVIKYEMSETELYSHFIIVVIFVCMVY